MTRFTKTWSTSLTSFPRKDLTMKYKRGFINATPALMYELLGHISSQPVGVGLTHLPAVGEQVFMFRSGAKLVYAGANQWGIHAYANGGGPEATDYKAAVVELEAAEHMRLAAKKLEVLDELMQVPRKSLKVYLGMQGWYTTGERTSTNGKHAS